MCCIAGWRGVLRTFDSPPRFLPAQAAAALPAELQALFARHGLQRFLPAMAKEAGTDWVGYSAFVLPAWRAREIGQRCGEAHTPRSTRL